MSKNNRIWLKIEVGWPAGLLEAFGDAIASAINWLITFWPKWF